MHPRGFFLHVTVTWHVPCMPNDQPALSSALPHPLVAQSREHTEPGVVASHQLSAALCAPGGSRAAGKQHSLFCSSVHFATRHIPWITFLPLPLIFFVKTRKLYHYCSTIFGHFAFLVQLMYSSVPFLFSFFFHFFSERTGTDL